MSNRYAFQPKGKGYTVYRTRTGTTRRSGSKGLDATLGGILVGLSVVVGVIWAAIKLAVYLLAAMLCIGAIALIVVGIGRCVKVIAAKRAKLERCRALVNDPEPVWEGVALPIQAAYANEKEEHFNQAFQAFLEAKNAQGKAEKHQAYLHEKRDALEYLKRGEEAAAMQNEISLAEKDIKAAQSLVSTRRYQHNAVSAAQLQTFRSLVENMDQKACGVLIGEFLVQDSCAVSTTDGIPLILTPSFAIRFDPRRNVAKLVPYSALTVTNDIRTELLEGLKKASDEVAFTCWQYQRKDGGPDLRYRDNSLYIYVYRGTVTIAAATFQVILLFDNRSKAVGFVESFERLSNVLA